MTTGAAMLLEGSVRSPAAPALEAPSERSGFEQYRDQLIHDWTKTLAALGFCLIPVFVVLDYFTMPGELLQRFSGYRAAGTVFALGQYFILRRTRAHPVSFLHGYAFSLMVGGMIVRMIIDLGGFGSAYYAGLILVVVATNLLIPWRPVHSAVNGSLIVGMYVIGCARWGGDFHLSTLINNLYFLTSTVIISVAISFLKHRLIEREYRLRAELTDVNATLDRSRGELKDARDALWGEMEVAKRIQTALLPANRKLNGYEVAAVMQPAAEVGGDYYEMFESRHGEHWLAIGDVSGHGVESGLVMMMTQTAILTMLDAPGRAPSDVVCAVNSVLRVNLERLKTGRYMTVNVIRLLPDGLSVAGKHQDLLVHRAESGTLETICNTGAWVGIVDDVREAVNDLFVPLGPGDSVLLFTDGVTEAMNGKGELFGQQRLAELFLRVGDASPADVLEEIRVAASRFGQTQEDDITLMMVKRTASGVTATDVRSGA